MCKKRTRFIEGRAMIVEQRGRGGAIGLAALRHVLCDGLGARRESILGII